ALIAAVMMFIPKKQIDDKPMQAVTFNKPLSALLAFVVGIGSGIVGAAGGFLLVPIMLVVLGIPTRMTIASSL
ncbi:sulfite exporter TauE/SafE family protein, partial [Clostridioides difficile]|nr:sulfite exporter TauE/SafE family protein [Clostridioides difficile]